jgi:hypothetical protein
VSDQIVAVQQLKLKRDSEIVNKIADILMNTKVEKCTGVLADGRGRYCAVGAILHELYNWNPEYKTEGTPLSLTNPEVNRMFNESILKELP